MASFRQFVRARQAAAAALAAPACLWSVSTTRLESASNDHDAQQRKSRSIEFVGVFLDKQSASQLKQQFPDIAIQNAQDDESLLYVVLKYNPTEKEKDAFAPILGHKAQIRLQAFVEDDDTQALLVKVETERGESVEFETKNDASSPQQITLATAFGTDGMNAGFGNVLLERLRANEKLQWVFDQEKQQQEEKTTEWKGELPAFESSSFPLYNPFPATNATVRLIKTESEVLKGTICMSSMYNAATESCLTTAEAKAECGFCKFMKAGPCGAEFTAWEACLDRCKKNGDDFIEKCGPETLALRDCVDANPEYYHVLNEDNNKQDEEAEAPKPE